MEGQYSITKANCNINKNVIKIENYLIKRDCNLECRLTDGGYMRVERNLGDILSVGADVASEINKLGVIWTKKN